MVRRIIGFSNVERVDARGFAWGIWLFWRNDMVEVELLATHNQAINALIRRRSEIDWLFTGLYASPNPNSREELWEYIEGVSRAHNLPWLVAGDMNEVRGSSEKSGGASTSQRRCNRFNKWINDCNLIDMGFSGPKYTWYNSDRLQLENGWTECSATQNGDPFSQRLGLNNSSFLPIGHWKP